ncbi:two-component system response regulator YesN [Cohnella sp. SGD-V74]|uniref:response regulator transcription factor n=1 Tax=unclassified Cohnella TaxID=2636738 RepID=UPI000D4DDDFE|nr:MULTISPECIES: response regulator [unclassified Cohnella]PRX70753.1 two-component system response regulator YesN [Cohnella sp. SGD-V74]
MMNVLIVDDEPLAVNYLVEALADMPKLQLNVTKAYSGKEALAKLGSGKVDILLTDIRMPGMSGMELADAILAISPRCRVIFLTGYNDFDYVQTAMRKGGVDYVLKTEGDGAIVSALEKAIADIESELNDKQIMQKARQQVHLALPSLRRDYLIDFLQGDVDSLAARKKRFAELDIDLDPERPVCAMLGRIDAWGSFSAPADRALLFYSIYNIAEEYFQSDLRFVFFQYDRTRTVWLLQPKRGESMESAQNAIGDGAERIQTACKSMLRIPLSIALSLRPVSWEEAGSLLEDLKLQLTFCMAAGEEVLMTESADREADERRGSSSLLLEIGRLRSNIHKLDLLESSMDNGQTEELKELYESLFRVKGELFTSEEGKWLGLELFSHLSAFFLTYLNKRKLIDAVEADVPIDKIYNPNQHAGLEAMLAFFGELGLRIAEHNGKLQKERSHGIVDRIHSYVHQFLHEELSLTKLAEIVYLSPPYLSRMYKQMTGQGLLEYINETRIQRGKLLLKQSDKKIHDIASEVGFESAPYFTRLFRKKMGMTPQEYRESVKGMDSL